jgi:alpha-ketoglutaric semialdehyde dehydrogenase
MPSEVQPVLIAGQWRDSNATGTFQAIDPNSRQPLAAVFPVSSWEDCDAALSAASEAAKHLRRLPPQSIADFLEAFAGAIEQAKERLVETAFAETGLPRNPRLSDVELPRTTNQLRQAAAAAASGDWARPIIDTQTAIRSCLEPLGPVCVFGPNNFPFAFNSAAGGDFAAAIAAGNPVIAKANSSHPDTTRLLSELALEAIEQSELPLATIQLLYRTEHSVGQRLVSDPRCGATGYTGSRHAGLSLKAAADRAGKPIYLELSSVNPVVITPAALQERSDVIISDYVTSALMGAGQFCTNPGLVVLIAGQETDAFIQAIKQSYNAATPGTLLSPGVVNSLEKSIEILIKAGAERLTDPISIAHDRCAIGNTLLQCSAREFLLKPELFQTEAFGNASLFVVAEDLPQAIAVLSALEGNLTGCIYSATDGSDESAYEQLAFALTPKVGRLLNDKMPTGVAVSPAMNHGGPFPATGHPGFTAVGMPTAISRFAKLTSYDNVRSQRLPALLGDKNPTGKTWRLIDGNWSQADIG